MNMKINKFLYIFLHIVLPPVILAAYVMFDFIRTSTITLATLTEKLPFIAIYYFILNVLWAFYFNKLDDAVKEQELVDKTS